MAECKIDISIAITLEMPQFLPKPSMLTLSRLIAAGGLGGTRKGGPEVNTKFSGREDSSMSR